MIETMLAAAILMIVVAGLLPLFTTAITQTEQPVHAVRSIAIPHCGPDTWWSSGHKSSFASFAGV